MAENVAVVVSCEHGGNLVPEDYAHLFAGKEELLASHRGYDIGVRPLAEALAEALSAPLFLGNVTRLLVDLNRSRGNRALFSEISRGLGPSARDGLLERYYEPYRRGVEEAVLGLAEGGRPVVHLSVHSFTPELEGKQRNADIGLLYDPSRPAEKSFCLAWQRGLTVGSPALKVRRNYPYRGSSDGLTSYLRSCLPAERYLGVELEVNQRLPLVGGDRWEQVQRAIRRSLCGLLAQFCPSSEGQGSP